MRYVISAWGAPTPDDEGILSRSPQVVTDLGGVPFSTSDGAFELPPDYRGVVPEDYAVVGLLDADHTRAVGIGYESCRSLDPCSMREVV